MVRGLSPKSCTTRGAAVARGRHDSRLSPGQLDEFARDGYVVVPNAVGDERMDAALRAINSWFLTGFHTDQLAIYRSQTYAPEYCGAKEVIGLFDECALSVASWESQDRRSR